MKSRLGYALSTISRPDILILDEVLAVGDLQFRLKCFDRINSIIDNAAVVFVSHSTNSIARICNRGLVLDEGKAVFKGTVDEAIKEYSRLSETSIKNSLVQKNPEHLKFTSENIIKQDDIYKWNDPESDALFNIQLKNIPSAGRLRVVLISSKNGPICEWNASIKELKLVNGQDAVLTLGKLPISQGFYKVRIIAVSSNERDVVAMNETPIFLFDHNKYSGISIQYALNRLK